MTTNEIKATVLSSLTKIKEMYAAAESSYKDLVSLRPLLGEAVKGEVDPESEEGKQNAEMQRILLIAMQDTMGLRNLLFELLQKKKEADKKINSIEDRYRY